MTIVNIRKVVENLYLDFPFRKHSCHDQIEPSDKPAKPKTLKLMIERIEDNILLGQVDYAATLWLGTNANLEWLAKPMGHVCNEMLFPMHSCWVSNLTRQGGSAENMVFSQVVGGSKHGE
jgi:hypothetical protein